MSKTSILLLTIALLLQIVSAAIPIPKAPSSPSIPKAPGSHPGPTEPGSDPGGIQDPEGEGGGTGNTGGGTGIGGFGGSNPPTVPPSNPADLGLFSQNGGKTPFTESNEWWEELLEKMRDILEDISSSLNSTSPATATASAFVAGTPSTITFKASEPSEACGAWASLTAYCSGADPSCGCYSRSYYVPDQWNSLAARCANSTGTMLSAAAQNTAYCTANVKNATSTRFAAVTPAPTSSYTPPAPPSYATAMSTPVSSAEKFSVNFMLTGLLLVLVSFVLVG